MDNFLEKLKKCTSLILAFRQLRDVNKFSMSAAIYVEAKSYPYVI